MCIAAVYVDYNEGYMEFMAVLDRFLIKSSIVPLYYKFIINLMLMYKFFLKNLPMSLIINAIYYIITIKN